MRFRSCFALAATLGLSIPAAASAAATYTVSMGPLPKDSSALEKTGAEIDGYFPSSLKVHVGDKVKFAPYGFHNAEFPKKGGSPNGLLAPSGTAAGINDAAGAAFWFNGQPTFSFNPVHLSSLFGKSATFNGSKAVNTGLPLADKPKPATITFTKQGTFSYFCAVHNGMKGQIQVKAKNAKLASPKAVAKAYARTIAKDKADASKLAKTKAPTNTVLVGAIKGRANYFGFLPESLTVPAGTTVEFKMPAGYMDVHSATFGPGVPASPEKDPTDYLAPIVKSFEGDAFDSRGVYPSEAPGTTAAFGPTLHGNGFWNSGILDTASATPLASSNKVTFATAGTFRYLCVIHPFMQGTIKVT